jgi:hypothetical protein
MNNLSLGNSVLSPKKSPFITVYYFLLFGLVVNFFITPNPYSAGHSGGAGRWAAVSSESWTLNTAVIMATALLIALALRVRAIHQESFYLSWFIALYLLINSVVTSGVSVNPMTYIYTAFSFCVVIILSKKEAVRSYGFNERFFLFLVLSLYLLSLALAIIRPGVWGWVPLEFGRETRGEMTLSKIAGLQLILLPAFLAFNRGKKSFIIILMSLLFFVEVSFNTRLTIYKFIAPVVLFFYASTLRKTSRSQYISFSFVFLFLAFIFVYFLFYMGYLSFNIRDIEDFTTGRAELWVFNFEVFLSNVLFGFGPNAQSILGYAGSATSEIGVLAAFSHYGIFFGVFQVCVVVMSCRKAFFIISTRNEISRISIFFSLIILTYLPIWLFFSGWRILSIESFIFWYAVFHLYFSDEMRCREWRK